MQPTKTPENLDMSYKFFNMYSIKDLAFRMIGFPIGLLLSLLISGIVGNAAAVFMCIIWTAAGWFIGSRKVLSNIPLLVAILWKRRLDRKSKVLINTRVHNEAEYSKDDNSKLNVLTNLIK